MSARFPMTKEGAQALRAELDRLKNVERRKISQAIGEARELGDLKENAEYHAAKEQQSFIEGRIKEIETKLSAAQVIDVKNITNDGKVIFGATIEILKIDEEKVDNFKIVGDDEVDIKNNKISFNSPIAKAMIGKYQGDTVEVKTPGGDLSYEILKVSYI